LLRRHLIRPAAPAGGLAARRGGGGGAPAGQDRHALRQAAGSGPSAVLAAAGLALLLAAAPAAAEDSGWHGRLLCDAVEGFTTRPLDVPFEVTVRRGLARYARPVLSAQSARTGVWERGEGRIGPDGAVVLEGGASGRGFFFTARYEGRLGPEGTADLLGWQEWESDGRRFRRACRATLSRSGG
jgi:hypothetical protein